MRPLFLLYLRWKSLRWQPAVGDTVLHRTMSGWIEKHVIAVLGNGDLRLKWTSRHGTGFGTYPRDQILFVERAR